MGLWAGCVIGFFSKYFFTKMKGFLAKMQYFLPKSFTSRTDFGDPTRHVAKVKTKQTLQSQVLTKPSALNLHFSHLPNI